MGVFLKKSSVGPVFFINSTEMQAGRFEAERMATAAVPASSDSDTYTNIKAALAVWQVQVQAEETIIGETRSTYADHSGNPFIPVTLILL